jgi:hypothetical protein
VYNSTADHGNYATVSNHSDDVAAQTIANLSQRADHAFISSLGAFLGIAGLVMCRLKLGSNNRCVIGSNEVG